MWIPKFSLVISVFGYSMLNPVGVASVDPLSNVTNPSSDKKPGIDGGDDIFSENRSRTVDPFILRADEACQRGEISGCFKSSAMVNLDWFLSGKSYSMSEHARILRISRGSTPEDSWPSARSAGSPEWGEFVEAVLQRVGTFVESAMIEVELTNELTQDGRYAPRFIDEITSEIDALDDKNDNIFSRTKMKKLLIPLLLVLKVFKLKLLLFLPLILGLASFKKLIGFLVIALPAIIGFLKICKPDLSHSYGSFGHSSYYNLPPHRRYPLPPGIYSRVGVNGHPSRSGDLNRERDAYQYAGASYQNYPYRNSPPSEDIPDDRHQFAYNSYHDM